MKRLAIVLAAIAAVAVGSPAAAQDMGTYAGTFTAIADGLGQSVGQGISSSQSVFVYAQGHAAISGAPAPASASPSGPVKPETYQVQVVFNAPTAVEAAGKRDALLGQMQAVAQRFNATMRTSEVAVVLGDPCSGPSRTMAMACMRRAAMAMGDPTTAAPAKASQTPAEKQFSATAEVSFSMADLSRAPAFLDALHAAGADSIGNMDEPVNVSNIFARPNTYAATSAISDKIWDDAARDAVRAARRQAGILAQADGRDVGAARQILFLSRTVESDQAVVTVAVRFDLAGAAKP
jgi:hypothetical protein